MIRRKNGKSSESKREGNKDTQGKKALRILFQTSVKRIVNPVYCITALCFMQRKKILNPKISKSSKRNIYTVRKESKRGIRGKSHRWKVDSEDDFWFASMTFRKKIFEKMVQRWMRKERCNRIERKTSYE